MIARVAVAAAGIGAAWGVWLLLRPGVDHLTTLEVSQPVRIGLFGVLAPALALASWYSVFLSPGRTLPNSAGSRLRRQHPHLWMPLGILMGPGAGAFVAGLLYYIASILAQRLDGTRIDIPVAVIRMEASAAPAYQRRNRCDIYIWLRDQSGATWRTCYKHRSPDVPPLSSRDLQPGDLALLRTRRNFLGSAAEEIIPLPDRQP